MIFNIKIWDVFLKAIGTFELKTPKKTALIDNHFFHWPETKLKTGPTGIQKSTGCSCSDVGTALCTASTVSAWIISSPACTNNGHS